VPEPLPAHLPLSSAGTSTIPPGHLGGFAYVILALWTLVASARLLFKPRPWQPFLHVAFAVYVGQLAIHNVIDNDHWRHLFLLYGILWGLIAAEKSLARTVRRAAAAAPAARPPLLQRPALTPSG